MPSQLGRETRREPGQPGVALGGTLLAPETGLNMVRGARWTENKSNVVGWWCYGPTEWPD